MLIEWRAVKGYDGVYLVSNMGNVKRVSYKVNSTSKNGNKFQSILPEKLLNATDNGRGYLIVGLSKNHVRKNHYVHRLVAESFLGDIPPGMVVNHKDYNTKNNCVDNLEVVTQKENIAYSSGRMQIPRKSNPASGYKHIRYRNGRYTVEIEWKNKNYYRGSYTQLENALKARSEIYAEINYYK